MSDIIDIYLCLVSVTLVVSDISVFHVLSAGQFELLDGLDNDAIIDFKLLEDFINNEAALHHM